MIKKWLKRVLLSLLILFVVASALLIATPTGPRLAVRVAQILAPSLHIGTVQGSLMGSIRVDTFAYQNESIAVTGESLRFSLNPWALLVSEIHMTDIQLQTLDITHEPSQQITVPSTTQVEPRISLPPVQIRVDKATVDTLTFNQGNTLYDIQNVELRAKSSANALDIDRLSLSTTALGHQPLALLLTGTFENSDTQALDILLKWYYNTPQTVFAGTTALQGPLTNLQIQQRLMAPVIIESQGTISHLLSEPSWQISHYFDQINLQLAYRSLPLAHLSGTLQTDGNLKHSTLTGTVNSDNLIPFPVTTDLSLTLEDKTLALSTATTIATSADSKPITLEGTINLTPDVPTFTLNSDWEQQSVPLTTTTLSNVTGSLKAQGSIEAYSLTMDSQLEETHTAQSQWHLEAAGTHTHFSVNTLQGQFSQGSVNATGEINWAQHLSWQTDINATEGILNALSPLFSTNLTGTLNATGTYQQDGLNTQSHLTLADNQLTLAANHQNNTWDLTWQLDAPTLTSIGPSFDGALSSSGTAQGSLPWVTLKADIVASQLKIMNTSAAQLNVSLELDPRTANSVFAADMTAQQLAVESYALDSITVDLTGNRDAHTLNIQSTIEDDTLTLSADGRYTHEQWTGVINTFNIDIPSIDSWQLNAPTPVSWRPGQVSVSELCIQASASASCLSMNLQEHDFSLNLTANDLPLRWLQLTKEHTFGLPGTFNANLSITAPAESAMRGQLHLQIPPSNIHYHPSLLLPDDFAYQGGQLTAALSDGILEGELNFDMADDSHIDATFTLSALNALPAIDVNTTPITADINATINSLAYIELLTTRLDNISGQAAVDWHVAGTLARPRFTGSSTISQGAFEVPELGIDISDLALNLSSTTIGELELTGQLTSGPGTLTISGQSNFNQPDEPTVITLTGENFSLYNTAQGVIWINPDINLTLKNRRIDIAGSVFIPHANIHPADVHRAITSSEDVILVSQADTAPPRVRRGFELYSNLRLILGEDIIFNGFDITTHVTGDLQLIDTPNNPTRATGELQLVDGSYSFHGQTLDISQGRLIFAGGLLTNPGLDVRAVRDITIQASRSLLLDTAAISESTSGTVGVEVEGTLQNPVFLLFSEPSLSDADKLSYLVLGVPSGNTTDAQGALLATAFNEISSSLGPSQSAGLLSELTSVTGIDSINIESTTSGVDPETGELQSQTSLVLGKSISPRLYLSYSIGLLNPVSIFYINYSLSRSWSLQSDTSTTGQSGGDILYRIDFGD